MPINNSLQYHKFKKEILYNIKLGLVSSQRSIALAEVYAITKKWLRLAESSEMIWGKISEFDNSVRKAQQTRVWYFSGILNRVQII
jgi:hypothetical protein